MMFLLSSFFTLSKTADGAMPSFFASSAFCKQASDCKDARIFISTISIVFSNSEFYSANVLKVRIKFKKARKNRILWVIGLITANRVLVIRNYVLQSPLDF